MISHKYGFIFVHIPKCAGSSIEKAFGHFDKSNSRGRQDHRSIRMIEKPFSPIKAIKNTENIKDTIRRFREHFRSHSNPNNKLQVSADQFRDYFKFTIVRNPWDRAYSWYKNAMRDPIHQKNYQIPPDISFDDFIRKFAGSGYLRPQTYWLENYNNKVELDFIGKFERLSQDYAHICKTLGVDTPALPHEVSSGSATKSDYKVSQATIDFVSNFYAKEIALLDYDFAKDSVMTTK
ncbi:sulfotransferase family 2 domain-containing protein [Glaciecola siphonariae]|uniref:Sulfotransferase family 2 domain-containing protein n=1 Tax=Glaciecola siphonariae TaxID=521012 RepID=A0ABV9LZG4_9ALTE